jgi:telomere length regulation protein
VVKELLVSLVLGDTKHEAHFQKLLGNVSNTEQRNVIHSILNLLSTDYLSTNITTENNAEWWKSDASVVSAAASLITLLITQADNRNSHLISWLTSSSGAGVGEGIAIRRAAVASVAASKSDIELVLDKCLSQFGDKLYIKHTPTLQQEGMAPITSTRKDLLITSSSCPSHPVSSWICPSNSTITAHYDDAIWKSSRRSIK